MREMVMTIPCKRYVKRFLEHNFGSPADLTRDAELYEDLRSRLVTPSRRRDSRVDYACLDKYEDEVKIRIAEDDFYRYGWELTNTDIVRFNRRIELRVKLLMHSVVSSYLSMGIHLNMAVSYFQAKFDYGEDVWKKESIIKDCQRNLSVGIDSFDGVMDNLSRMVVNRLAEANILTKKYKKNFFGNIVRKKDAKTNEYETA